MILLPVNDGRMIAVNADTGKACESFGNHGTLDLLVGIGVKTAGFYEPTSPSVVSDKIVVVAGAVIDNYSTHAPSGVIRGFDIHTGKLIWAWDAGATDENALPSAKYTYTENSPNSWMTASYDAKLGLDIVEFDEVCGLCGARSGSEGSERVGRDPKGRRLDAMDTGNRNVPSLAAGQETARGDAMMEGNDLTPLVGSWRVKSVGLNWSDTGERIEPYGPSPEGFMLLEPGGRVMFLFAKSGRQQPSEGAGKAALFDAMVAYTGTVRMDGPDVS